MFGVAAEVGDGGGAVLDGLTDGGVEVLVHLEQGQLGGMFKIETIVDGHSDKATVGKELAALDGILVVAFAREETAPEDIDDTGVIGPRVNGLIDIQLQIDSVAGEEGEGLLGGKCAGKQDGKS